MVGMTKVIITDDVL